MARESKTGGREGETRVFKACIKGKMRSARWPHAHHYKTSIKTFSEETKSGWMV